MQKNLKRSVYKNIALFEPPVRFTFNIRHIAKHMMVATLPTAGIQAPSAAILFIVKVGTVEALRCCMNLNLGGKLGRSSDNERKKVARP